MSLPVAFATLAILASLALLIVWLVVVAHVDELVERPAILVLGVLSPAVLITVFLMFVVILVRRILELNRQNRFIDSVTHELKSPLASLRLGLDTLDRPDLADAQQEQVRRMMRGDVGRLTGFIDDVLTASRLEHRDTAYEAELVSIQAEVEACATLIRDRYDLGEGALVVTGDPTLELRTDRTSLSVVVTNLLDNAVKYSDPDAVKVTATVTLEGKHLTIVVADRGIGLAKRELKRVLQRFYRVPDENVRERRGTGLGLFVASQTARTLGGRLLVSSDGPGLGTTMLVRLPAK
ncbi:MAG: signal transduction histidine kinase [Myxococcota bacterium]